MPALHHAVTPLSHKRPSQLDRFWFGAAYYPEHWDESERACDREWMHAAGFNLVRMAEFAWDRMEPEEGAYDFTFFDDVINHLGEAGISTMLCTPTATPPRWLSYWHPEMLRVDANGRTMTHGSRQHACHTHPVLREYSRKITRAMAEHFKNNPYVVGWQTDNEFHCHFSETYTESAEKLFHEFLKERFDNDIAVLNRTWGTAFWSQSYRSFDEIPLPRPHHPAPPNPGHWLDYKRFLSYAVTLFQRDQIDILRAANPDWWILHNGTFGNIDYRGPFSMDLDIFGHDAYPMFAVDPAERKHTAAFNLDRVRCLTGNFFIPEHQSSGGGQNAFYTPNPEPGEMRLQSFQSIAHGADSLLYFRWRTCRFGAEEYWCGIIDHDNRQRRRYRETCQIGREIRLLEPLLKGSSVAVDCAVAWGDFDVRAGNEAMRLGMEPESHYAEGVHNWFHRKGYAIGCVHPEDDLSDLHCYVIPHWTLFNPAWLEPLTQWVQQGGTLILGARTATRTMDNQVITATPPGCLRELCGVEVEESGRAPAGGRPFGLDVEGNHIDQADGYYEWISAADDVDILGTWTDRFLAGTPAVTRRKLGAGQVIYIATHLSNDLLDKAFPSLLARSAARPLRPMDQEWLEVVERRNSEHRVFFYLNHHATQSLDVELPAGYDVLEQVPVDTHTVSLEPFGVKIRQTAPPAE